jgi:hypothetical protein
LFGTVVLLRVATKGARWTRRAADVLETEDGPKSVNANFEDEIVSKEFGGTIAEQQPLVFGTSNVNRLGIGIDLIL